MIDVMDELGMKGEFGDHLKFHIGTNVFGRCHLQLAYAGVGTNAYCMMGAAVHESMRP